MVFIFNKNRLPSGNHNLIDRLIEAFNSGLRPPDGLGMEWVGPLLTGILVFVCLLQIFWAHAISAITQKTEQSDLMQVLAWIPLLQIAPILAAGGSGIGRFLTGMIVLVIGNATLVGVSAFLGNGLGGGIAVLGAAFTGLLCLFYFGGIACRTAAARDLPGWIGLLLFIPILNFFVYPYIAFHDGWVGPNKIGMLIGSILIVGSTAPAFKTVQSLTESGVLSPEGVLAAALAELNNAGSSGELLGGVDFDSLTPPGETGTSDLASKVERAQAEEKSIRLLYKLKSRFDTLDTLATPEKLMVDEDRSRTLEIIESIRQDLEDHREELDPGAFSELGMHLLELEARVHSPPSTSRVSHRKPRKSNRPRVLHEGGQIGPAAIGTANEMEIRSYSNQQTPPRRPYPVEAAEACPAGTELRERKRAEGEEEWCQQLASAGGLRHGWYARYLTDGRPESMGHYEDGLRIGVWTRFYPTGEVRAQALFEKGLQHGWVLTFDEEGNPTRSARFEEGLRVDAR